jgi:uncharacterized DUF497 family protein
MEGPWNAQDFRLVLGSTAIDYDPSKELANRAKHGYSLESATFFFSRLLLPIPQPPYATRDASTESERRHEHLVVDDDGKVLFMVSTMREDETVRLISVRRASVEERTVFGAITDYVERVDA